jgi:hypothetical protein
MQIIGLVGFADSGKGTASKVLVDRGWRPIAFADALKDALAAMFGWPRELIEGDTAESRRWRETVDEWWAAKLGIPQFTPRFAMQNVGTDVLRKHFHDDLWVFRMEREILDTVDSVPGIVLTDVRFPNECAMARRMNGRIFRVRRGPEPPWMDMAEEANGGSSNAADAMRYVYGVHESEWRWIGMPLDAVIDNDGSADDLRDRLLKVVGK